MFYFLLLTKATVASESFLQFTHSMAARRKVMRLKALSICVCVSNLTSACYAVFQLQFDFDSTAVRLLIKGHQGHSDVAH